MMEKLLTASLKEIAEKLHARSVTSRALTEAYLHRIDRMNDSIGAYITVCRQEALRQADEADHLLDTGNASFLCGIPMAVKDNIATNGVRTTCASRMLERFIPPYDATAYARLRAQGCVLLGKTNMDEFGMGSSTENSAFFPTRNPADPVRVPGGSSGGSAAAVAAGLCAFALGSDTGGSVRQPASHCGVVGLKPTYGCVSRYGLVAFASSLEQIGPITRSCGDAEQVLQAMAGYDRMDATTLREKLTPAENGKRVWVVREMLEAAENPAVRACVMNAAQQLAEQGLTVEEISIPALKGALSAYYVISSAEASSNLGRYDGIRYGRRAEECETLEELYLRSRSEGFGMEVKRRILMGTHVLSAGYYEAYYARALKVREAVRKGMLQALENCDALLTPVAPDAAPLLGEHADEPASMYRSDIMTVPANLAGLPAVSIPFGRDEKGLPVGVQLIGGMLQEKSLLNIGRLLEGGR